jgi:hypothetical protein
MTLRSGEGPRLRLTEHAEAAPGRYRVEVALEGDGAAPTVAEKRRSPRKRSSSWAWATRGISVPGEPQVW